MISLMRRGLPALVLAALPLLASPASAGTPTTPVPTNELPFTSYAPPQAPAGAPGSRVVLALFDAIDRLPVAEEHREGYQRTLYKHWNPGLNAADGCNTRKEVILAEAVEDPLVEAGCKLSGGSWRSAYDSLVVTDAAKLDVDHFVPLAEVFDSERTPWSAERREAYANDQGSADTLIAVSAASNRSKSDKDPADWMPADGTYHCAYAATWVATKLRWDLAVDDAERQALLGTAEDCTGTTVTYQHVP
ncbi:HNH endonuclease family protein [Streptomyces sp. ITFR-6]|uniref:HNH endonuclease family protein n=1 Tax=Streptomyces sp. ITFR-6 TaxID=3075197 RepID=UPI00288B032D|nr:HNH endonuclease family protein [Streptomyces sp. ITFR-6]WNI34476.1 HNH endonuclease family protein [Streptomyces sp. ITFR-6]